MLTVFRERKEGTDERDPQCNRGIDGDLILPGLIRFGEQRGRDPIARGFQVNEAARAFAERPRCVKPTFRTNLIRPTLRRSLAHVGADRRATTCLAMRSVRRRTLEVPPFGD